LAHNFFVITKWRAIFLEIKPGIKDDIMSQKFIMILLLSASLLVGCASRTGWIAPPYTNVERILNVQPGMTISDVNLTLGIDPYDVYYIYSDGSFILVYNYRLKYRMMDESTIDKETIRNERSQTVGEPIYRDYSSRLYVKFKDNIVQSLITDAGKENAEYILLVENNIQLLTAHELDTIRGFRLGDKYFIDSSQPSMAVIQLWEREDSHKPTEAEVREKKVPRGLIIIGAIAGVVGVIYRAIK
jgi:hypothetical protein